MKTLSILIILGALTGWPWVFNSDKIDVIKNFNSTKYLGKWYEIARLDYKWEKNLNNVTAFYSLKENGMISVHNKGFDHTTQKWKDATGKAKFAGDKNEGKLKVSFFGPFYADYNIIALDTDYNYALVIGNNTDYMWILSRKTSIPEDIKAQFMAKAKELGIETEKLVWVEHNVKE